MNKIVAFDIDGVLADFEGRLVDCLVDEFRALGSMNRSLFSLDERFKNHPEILERSLEYVNDPNFYYGLEPIQPTVDFVKNLMERGYWVMYLTSRPRTHEAFTRRWLEKYTWNYKDSRGLLCGIDDKADFLYDVDVAFLVDDNPKEFTRCKKRGVNILVWEQPWNEGLFPRLYSDKNGEVMLWGDESKEALPIFSVISDYEEVYG